MATYKVIQNIEAEDKILGPLTLKQILFGFLALILIGGGIYFGNRTGHWYLSFVCILVGLIPAFFALPLGREQPNEVWFKARWNFFFNPRLRLWQQLGNGWQGIVFVHQRETEAVAPPPTYSSKEIADKAEALSTLLDRSEKPPGTQPAASLIDAEHTATEAALGYRFDELLNAHHLPKKQQTIEAAKSYAAAPIEADQQILGDDGQNTDIIKPTTQAEDLKISTLAAMATNLRKQQSL